jgi:hypothetical protein
VSRHFTVLESHPVGAGAREIFLLRKRES